MSLPTILLRLWPKIITVGLHVDAITEHVYASIALCIMNDAVYMMFFYLAVIELY